MAEPRSRRVFLGAAVTGAGLLGAGAGGLAGSAYGEQHARDTVTPRELQRRAAGTTAVFEVTDYGVKGDGRTDDAAALNALIAAVSRQGGGVLVFPRGEYLVGSSVLLRSGVQLVSGAANHGYLPLADPVSAVTLIASSGLSGFVVDTEPDGAVSAGLSGIDIRGTSRCGGVRLRKASWCVVSRSSIDTCGEQAVLLTEGLACVFEDLITTNALLDRSRSAVTGTFDIDGTDHYVSRCEFNASLRDKSSPAKRVAAAVIRGSNHFVADSVGELSDVGLVVEATYSRFTGVRADTNWGDGFVVSGFGNLFAACSAIGNGQATTDVDSGWLITGGGNSFAACSVHTPGATAVRYGFRDTQQNAEAQNRNSYVGCTVDAAATARWSTAGYLGSAPSFSAHPVRPRSGTTEPDVSQTTLVVLFDYSAPTVVTGFSNGVTGQTIRVIGSDQVTLRRSERLRTNTGSDKRLSTDAVYSFTCYDGDWFEAAP